MPDDPHTPLPPGQPVRYTGTGLAGETTRGQDSSLRFEPNQPLEVIGDFEVLSKLGQGGMGTVYRARQVSLDRQVALKLLPSNFEADAEFVARFQREARVAANLKHPNLVRVYTSGVANGSHFIAMELIEGETLSDWIKRGKLPPLEALRIVLDVTRALECGWRTAQLIHRDIKPGNIFISTHGDVKLGDLGLAKVVGSDTTGLTQTGTAMGTPHYISPEQARGDKDLDFRADIYSLGCTLYQMLTGQTPYSGTDPVAIFHHHLHSPPPAILKVQPQCPLPLARLVAKMLKKQRRERQASYEELIAQIESVRAQLDPALAAALIAASGAETQATPEVGKARRAFPDQGTRGAASRPAKSKLPLYGGIVAGLLVLGIVGWLIWPKEEKLTAAQRYAREHASESQAKADAAAVLASLNDATKDAPLVNTLGMKFVPVPIVGGPTNGQPVLFSVWDTRVQDYAEFVKETKREWPKTNFEQGPAHPAVMVSWEDAQLFCQWLTQREQAAGRLPVGFSYRLPSDHEWSCAVELGAKEDAAKLPSEKSQKTNYAFPWGTEWPPPKGAGNYAGEELRPALTAGQYTYVKDVMAGYNDGFVNTSPVGSFAANRFGLYDMGGNVWQWCEDWYDNEQNRRVLRGESWNDYDHYYLLSSTRYHGVPGHRSDNTGFRCVLAPSGAPAEGRAPARPQSSPNAALEPGAIRLWDSPEKVTKDMHGASWEDGALRLDKGVPCLKQPAARDAVLRARIRMTPDAEDIQLRLRFRGTSDVASEAYYRLLVSPSGAAVGFESVLDGKSVRLAKWPLERHYEATEWVLFEFRAVGEQLTASADGKVVGTVRDASITTAGGVMLFANANGYFRDIEYVPLDQPADGNAASSTPPGVPTAKSSSPTESTKENPFVNTLGMKFVPVPIIGGPTSGQPVLFSIWETREQDYGLFIAETKRTWSRPNWPKEEMGPKNPAVAMSQVDATAFCAWLTDRERKAGQLGANELYRLPSDHEWSCAVGIGDREDPSASPAEKNGKIPGMFPWGTAWPLPHDAGNYAGHETITWNKSPPDTDSDSFPRLAPVGSFASNRYGIFDLGGNASEWCGDVLPGTVPTAVNRGANWATDVRNHQNSLLSSTRSLGSPVDAGNSFTGFRCVVAPASPPPPAAVPATSSSPPADAQRYGHSLFKVVAERKSWWDAKKRAEEMGGHLATIDSPEKNQWLAETFLKGPIFCVWIGAHKGAGGHWQWVDGKPFGFAGWEPRNGTPQPDPGEYRDYATFRKNAVPSGSRTTAVWVNRNDGGEDVQHPFFLVEWEGGAASSAAPAAAK